MFHAPADAGPQFHEKLILLLKTFSKFPHIRFQDIEQTMICSYFNN